VVSLRGSRSLGELDSPAYLRTKNLDKVIKVDKIYVSNKFTFLDKEGRTLKIQKTKSK
jgi:hypothetical protein